jgi:FAD/FMN-containing dehydrogenase
MEDYLAEVNQRLESRYSDVHNFTFGHMGDGNLHLVVSVGQGGPETRRSVESCVYEPLVDIHGSVSAEHGVGLEKKPYLEFSRSPEEIELMRTIKKALDPNDILNPGKIFDVATSGEAAA